MAAEWQEVGWLVGRRIRSCQARYIDGHPTALYVTFDDNSALEIDGTNDWPPFGPPTPCLRVVRNP